MFIIPLCLFLISTYLRPKTQAELSYLITAVECLSGLWCVLFAPFQVQIPLVGFLLIRNRKAIRSILLRPQEEEGYLDLSDQSTPTIDIEATSIETVSLTASRVEDNPETVIDKGISDPPKTSIQTSEESHEVQEQETVESSSTERQHTEDLPTVTETSTLDIQVPQEKQEEQNTSEPEIIQSASTNERMTQDIPRVVLAPFRDDSSVMPFNQIKPHAIASHNIWHHDVILSTAEHSSRQHLFQLQPSASKPTPFIQISF